MVIKESMARDTLKECDESWKFCFLAVIVVIESRLSLCCFMINYIMKKIISARFRINPFPSVIIM